MRWNKQVLGDDFLYNIQKQDLNKNCTDTSVYVTTLFTIWKETMKTNKQKNSRYGVSPGIKNSRYGLSSYKQGGRITIKSRWKE